MDKNVKRIKWGIIGCGGIATKRTIPGMLLGRNAICQAVMDINEQVVREVQNKFHIPDAYTSLEALLKSDIDAVYIATPVFCHREQVMKAAEAGKHILLEKPMGLSCKEGEEMSAFCYDKKVKLGIGFMMRFHGAHQKIKKLIKDGLIGEVVSAYAKFNCWYPEGKQVWRQNKVLAGGGAMMDMGIHSIDLLQYVTGLRAESIVALCGNQIFSYAHVEDAASAVLKMNNGALFSIESNFNIPGSVGCKLEIYGTHGCVIADGTMGQTESGSVRFLSTDCVKSEYSFLDYESGNMYTKEIEAFSDAIINNTRVPVTAEEAIFDQRIVEAIYESQELEKHIHL